MSNNVLPPFFRNELIDELQNECASLHFRQHNVDRNTLQLDPDMAAIQAMQHMELQRWLEFSPDEIIRDVTVHHHRLPYFQLGSDEDNEHEYTFEEVEERERKIRNPNRWGYSFGDWMTSTFYLDWLDDEVRPGESVSARKKTYEQSRDPK